MSLEILAMLLFGIGIFGIFVLGIILAINQINAQVYENQSILCVPNLNSNKSNDLECEETKANNANNATLINATEFFLNNTK